MSEVDGIKLERPEGRLDRLVDGELSETDRRDLLLQLEREPEGWRRCALAFLEAQCWRQELGLMARSPERTSTQPAPDKASPRFNGPAMQWAAWRQRLATALSMGACFLIALALGRGWSGGSAHGPGTSQVEMVTQPIGLGEAPTVARPADKWEVVTLAADSPEGNSQTVNIPAVRRDAVDENLLQQAPDAIPPGVQRVLEQAGHRVQQQRQIVPIQMDSGHRLMVPVNQVEIHYVGRGSL
jgi:hypothetical protein